MRLSFTMLPFYAGEGLHLIPLKKLHKDPLTYKWNSPKWSFTLSEMRQYMREGHNIGVIPNLSTKKKMGLYAIDYDTVHVRKDVLRVDTFIVNTPKPGYQLFIWAEDDYYIKEFFYDAERVITPFSVLPPSFLHCGFGNCDCKDCSNPRSQVRHGAYRVYRQREIVEW